MTWLDGVGAVGTGLFGVRVVYQWVASERAGRTLIPRGYWGLSLTAAALVLFYAVSLHDAVYVMSVLPGAVIAYLNMRIKGTASRRKLLPWAVAFLGLVGWAAWAQPRLGHPVWATIGLIGSAFWGTRHVFQWWVSERRGVPTLPASFYIFSLVGSLFLLAYASAKANPVMIASYAFNFVPYLRLLRLLRPSTPAAAGSS
jgi:lipid-A-disaccharide synthase-like uncharacterized protein